MIKPPPKVLRLGTTRRTFVRTSLLGGALAWTVPAFVQRTFAALDRSADGALVQPVTGRDGRILVIVQLAGGNDGLNTIVPYTDDEYFRARPRLALERSELVTLNDQFALNGKLLNLQRLFGDGQASVIHGVGYPNPNRSHFRSTEIWHAGSSSTKESTGWVGRYFDSCCSGEDPTVGIALGKTTPQTFANDSGLGITMERPDRFQFRSDPFAWEMDSDDLDGNEGGSIEMLPGQSTSAESPAAFVERVATDARLASDRIASVLSGSPDLPDFPKSNLGQQLRTVAQLIAGGLPTRVYYVSIGGFDTHAGQAGRHNQLLSAVDEAIGAFSKALKQQGNFERVLLMTFSEFGRRVAENNSGGTDHGAAAPLFLVGGNVAGGFIGSPPSLSDLDNGDLRHSTDFRSVYTSILESWLEAPSQQILQAHYPLLPILRST